MALYQTAVSRGRKAKLPAVGDQKARTSLVTAVSAVFGVVQGYKGQTKIKIDMNINKKH